MPFVRSLYLILLHRKSRKYKLMNINETIQCRRLNCSDPSSTHMRVLNYRSKKVYTFALRMHSDNQNNFRFLRRILFYLVSFYSALKGGSSGGANSPRYNIHIMYKSMVYGIISFRMYSQHECIYFRLGFISRSSHTQ